MGKLVGESKGVIPLVGFVFTSIGSCIVAHPGPKSLG